MLNYQDLCLINEVDFFKDSGVNNFSIDARWKNIDYVNNIGKIYKDAINLDDVSKNNLNSIKKYSPNISSGNFTRGF
jgi:collagenase-like PrtC family protease